MASSTQPRPVANFTTLPREVRDRIYTYLVLASGPGNPIRLYGEADARARRHHHQSDQAVAETLQNLSFDPRFQAEALQAFYAVNTFRIDCASVPDLAIETSGSGPIYTSVRDVIANLQVVLEYGSSSTFSAGSQAGYELRVLLQCPRLRQLDVRISLIGLRIARPLGPDAEPYHLREMAEVAQVCKELKRRIGSGLWVLTVDSLIDEGVPREDLGGSEDEEVIDRTWLWEPLDEEDVARVARWKWFPGIDRSKMVQGWSLCELEDVSLGGQ